MTRDGTWEIGGHTLNLTNLDKVLFPDGPFTKRDLIRYYVTVAPVLLPYLHERPLNVDRWPDGVTGAHFWQKQIPSHAPAWVQRWDYPEAGHDESHTYVVCDRVATLAWLANQACIDLHPWTSKLPDWYLPTYALIDVDPGEKTTWDQVVTLTKLYRRALDHLGMPGLPQGDRQARHPGLGADRAEVHLRRDAQLGCRALAGHRTRRAATRQLGVGQAGAARPCPSRLHPERGQQDPRRAVRRAPGSDRPAYRSPSPGTSSTTPTSARTAGTSAPRSRASNRSATSSAARWICNRSCPRSSRSNGRRRASTGAIGRARGSPIRRARQPDPPSAAARSVERGSPIGRARGSPIRRARRRQGLHRAVAESLRSIIWTEFPIPNRALASPAAS